jgi:hypothetical protein
MPMPDSDSWRRRTSLHAVLEHSCIVVSTYVHVPFVHCEHMRQFSLVAVCVSKRWFIVIRKKKKSFIIAVSFIDQLYIVSLLHLLRLAYAPVWQSRGYLADTGHI